MANDAEFAAKPHARRAPMRHRMAGPYWKFPFCSIRGKRALPTASEFADREAETLEAMSGSALGQGFGTVQSLISGPPDSSQNLPFLRQERMCQTERASASR